MGIGETLRWALAKLVMRAVGDQEKTVCGNLQLCAGLEAGIDWDNHAVGQRRLARVMERQEKAEEADEAEDAEEEEEQSEGIVASLSNLIIETAGTEEEATEGLAAELGMEVEEERDSKGGEEGGGSKYALEDLEFLTQEEEPSGTTPIDACNRFNDMSRLVMLWTVQHRWPTGARFAFNCYRH